MYYITLQDNNSIQVLHKKSFDKFQRDTQMIKSIIEDIKAISKSSFIHTITRRYGNTTTNNSSINMLMFLMVTASQVINHKVLHTMMYLLILEIFLTIIVL